MGRGVAAPGSPGGSAQLPRQAKVTYSGALGGRALFLSATAQRPLRRTAATIFATIRRMCVIDYVLITVCINYVMYEITMQLINYYGLYWLNTDLSFHFVRFN